MSEEWHDPTIGVDGLTCYQRWLKHDAPHKAECRSNLCVSYVHPINCADCDEENK